MQVANVPLVSADADGVSAVSMADLHAGHENPAMNCFRFVFSGRVRSTVPLSHMRKPSDGRFMTYSTRLLASG